MGKPRIAMVTPGTFDPLSGRSSSVEQTVRSMAGQMSAQADIFIIGKQSGMLPAEEVVDGVTYVRCPASSVKQYIRAVRAQLRGLAPHIIQVENRPEFVPLLQQSFPHVPIWLFVHSLTFVSGARMRRRPLRRCLRKAQRIWVNSQYIQRQLARLCPAVRSRICVNYLGVDPERFRARWLEQEEGRQSRMAEKGLAGRQIIMYAGRLLPMKGVHYLLQAMPRICSEHPQAMLVIVGAAYYGSDKTTRYVARLRRLAAQLPGRVRFVPFVPHDEMPDWYRLADVVVVPSVAKEAFGLVNVEAMASGAAVAASRVGGIREIIEHGRSGLLLNPNRLSAEVAAAVSLLLRDDALRRALAEGGVARVHAEFTWRCAASRMLAAVAEILSK